MNHQRAWLVGLAALALLVPLGTGLAQNGTDNQTSETNTTFNETNETNTTGENNTTTSDAKTIEAKIGDHECNADEWQFVINQIDSEENAPATVNVTFEGDIVAEVDRSRFTPGGVAQYRTSENLESNVTSANTTIHATWDGQFNLGHGPCPEDGTGNETSENETDLDLNASDANLSDENVSDRNVSAPSFEAENCDIDQDLSNATLGENASVSADCSVTGTNVELTIDQETNVVSNITLADSGTVLFDEISFGEQNATPDETIQVNTVGSQVFITVAETQLRVVDTQSAIGVIHAEAAFPVVIHFDEKVDLEPVDNNNPELDVFRIDLADGRILFVKAADASIDETANTLTLRSDADFRVVGDDVLGADDYDPVEKVVAQGDTDAEVFLDEETLEGDGEATTVSFRDVVIENVRIERTSQEYTATSLVRCDCSEPRVVVYNIAIDELDLGASTVEEALQVRVDGSTIAAADDLDDVTRIETGEEPEYFIASNDANAKVLLSASDLQNGREVELFSTQSADQHQPDGDADNDSDFTIDPDEDDPSAQAPLGATTVLVAAALAAGLVALARRRVR